MILVSPLLITLRQENCCIRDGAIVINRGVIVKIGSANAITKAHRGHRVLHIGKSILMPGLVNLHTHLELPPLLHEIRAKTFVNWILNLIKAKKALNDANYRTAVLANISELVKTGTTTIGEICSQGESPSLLEKSKLRAVIFHEVISMNPNESPIRLSSITSRPSSLIRYGFSPHAPYTVSESALRSILRSTQKSGRRIAMHIAESNDEIRLLQRGKSGLEKIYHYARWDLNRAPKAASSFEYLKRIGFLSPNLLAVHAVQVVGEDIELIRKSGASIAHCPRSNKELRVGRMPLRKFLDAGIAVGLGTDSLASAPSLSLWDEMRYACKIHRRDGVSAADLFRLATIGGATALGLDKEIGTLEPGKKADIIAVPLPKKDTGDPYSDLLRETKSCIMTMVNGRILYPK